MKSLLLYISINVMLSTFALAQDAPVKIVFEEEGIEEPIRELSLIIIDKVDSVSLESESNILTIPRELYNRRVILRFTVNGNSLIFRDVPVAWNNELLQWTLVYDKKPFDKERFWMIKNWRKVKKAIYSLDYGNGKQVTDYL